MSSIFDVLRLIENMVRVGTIAEVDHEKALARVAYDKDEQGQDIKTDWLKWGARRASNNRDWWAPETGEQVLFLSVGGELALGVIVCAIYQTAHQPPSNDPNKHVTQYSDGTVIEYDTLANKLTVSVVGGEVVINTDTSTTVNATENVVLNAQKSATVNAAENVVIAAGVNVDINAAGVATTDATAIALNGGSGVVTKECICHFTGLPHSDGSSTVTAGK